MDKRYQDQVVMITGAGSGFGRLAAQKFAAEGARLALSDISEEPLDALATELRGAHIDVLTDVVDVSKEADIAHHTAHIADQFGQLDVAVNNAGMGHDVKPLQYLSVEEFDLNMAVNARGVFLGMKYQIPMMLKQGQGAILNTASAAGLCKKT